MNETERGLVALYDKRLDYHSPLDYYSAPEIAALVGVEPRGPALDIGCGDGRLGATAPGPLDGLDASGPRVAAARARGIYRDLWRADIYASSALDRLHDHSPFPVYREWTTIWAIEVLEHLADPWDAVAKALLRLPPDGHLIATVPLRLPGKTHLQVFESAEDAGQRLAADRFAAFTAGRYEHAALAWEAPADG